jgi:tRNA/rRNA methyltransferase
MVDCSWLMVRLSSIINHPSSIINHQSPIINHPSSITNQQSPINNHQSPINNHQSPIINHQSSITHHQSPINNHQSSITNQQSPINNHQSPINNHQSTITNQQSTINNHQSSINNQQSPINNQQSTITNHQSTITNHQSSITNHQSPINNHQSSITNHQSPINNHQSTIINHQSSITNHQSPIINHQSTITNQQSPITNHQSPITNHQSPITNQQSTINNHQSSIINHQSTMKQIKIILVEPAGELNIGSIARVMKNMGLNQLVIVNPQCDPFSETAKIMAVHGVDVLENATIVDSLPLALTGTQRAIATTGRNRGFPTLLETPKQVLPWLLEDQSSSALIFGREDRGLTNQELNYAQRLMMIPANPEYPSLNLAQAVAVCAYELYQLSLDSPQVSTIANESVTLDELEGYFQHLESVLLKINYLYPHTAKARMEKFRRLYHKANLQKQELAMLRGILRQFQWRIEN